ncbi:MAG: FAD-binding and (Fe-S)-binding domain-containing protein [Bacteroidales bacterium]|nr:FAD-binding and (Fe-S)-binding domain-containing protein [Bacteroidales bacterium]
MLSGNYKVLYQQLVKTIDSKRIFHDPLYTLAFGTDASFYRLIPKMVVRANDENEVSLILKESAYLNISVTFRAAGTSLSGQAITDSVLVIAGNHWKNFRISKNGSEIRMQPGLRGGYINTLLAPFGRKIGPDPASIDAAMIGGIAANNASGMCCGTAENSYKTVAGIRIILADGTIMDTKDQPSRNAFRESHSKLLSRIADLAKSAKENTALAERIRRKYKMKNTTGYSLNALVDFTDPFDIIEHLMIGSEGTLGFFSDITFRTVIEQPFRASSLMIFPDIEKACIAVSILKSTPVSAVELIDRAGLRSVENETGMPEFLKLLGENVCALLVETVAPRKSELDKNIEIIKVSIQSIQIVRDIHFTDIPAEYELLWKIRKGLFPSVGAMRKSGTTVIIEDVAFPVPYLAKATLDLQKLLKKFNYKEAVIFGHALEGNLHFVFTQDFSTQAEIDRYARLMTEVSELVVNKYDGSLKAEHGTGRNMAPFVEMEWGKEAYQLMKEIKHIFDPLNILNPGVILNSDQQIHIRNLKPIPAANEVIDKCTECGFCEPSCVSADLTLTPRQRIVVHREMISLSKSRHEPHIAASLAKSFVYAGNQTCATDGLCSLSCPVKIDTGKLIKNLRSEQFILSQNRVMWIANRMSLVTAAARRALSIVSFFHTIMGTHLLKGISGGLRKISGNVIPFWNPFMQKGAREIKVNLKLNSDSSRKVVYFPSCINRSMGVSSDHKEEMQLSEKMVHLLNKGGYEVIYPENLNNLCCGMAFSSKGYTEVGEKKSNELEAALLKASNNGEYPVLFDMSPCLYTMKENMKSNLKLYEPVEFITLYLIPHLKITPVDEVITVFPVCSMKKMGLENKLVELARICATDVIVAETNCCGFAGDRGFTYPELNKHGLGNLRTQLPETIKHGYSTSRTCEIGLSLHTGISHKSIVYLADQVSSTVNNSKPERSDRQGET